MSWIQTIREESKAIKDAFYDSETPSDAMDYTFAFLMTVLHVYYLLKLLDYSLSRIHPTIEGQLEQEEFRIRDKVIKKHEKKFGDNIDEKKVEMEVKREMLKSRNNIMNKEGINGAKMIGTNADFSTKTRTPAQFVKTKHLRVCCLIKTVPKWINWQRTRTCRWFLRFFLTLSVILGLVLYLEFFGNIIAEFFITCVTNRDQYYYLALIILPFLLYSVETLIRIVWHSVLISWETAPDVNGEIESYDNEIDMSKQDERGLFIYSYQNGFDGNEWDDDALVELEVSIITTDDDWSDSNDDMMDNKDDDDQPKQSHEENKKLKKQNEDLDLFDSDDDAKDNDANGDDNDNIVAVDALLENKTSPLTLSVNNLNISADKSDVAITPLANEHKNDDTTINGDYKPNNNEIDDDTILESIGDQSPSIQPSATPNDQNDTNDDNKTEEVPEQVSNDDALNEENDPDNGAIPIEPIIDENKEPEPKETAINGSGWVFQETLQHEFVEIHALGADTWRSNITKLFQKHEDYFQTLNIKSEDGSLELDYKAFEKHFEGKISNKELIKLIFNDMDQTKDGLIKITAIQRWINNVKTYTETIEPEIVKDEEWVINQLKNVNLSDIDIDDDNTVDIGEFMNFFKSNDIGIDENILNNIFDEIDGNGDGSISVIEFSKWKNSINKDKMKKLMKKKNKRLSKINQEPTIPSNSAPKPMQTDGIRQRTISTTNDPETRDRLPSIADKALQMVKIISDHEDSKERKRLEKERQKREKRRKKIEKLRQQNDYFIATCWRFWFFVINVGYGFLGAIELKASNAVGGLFLTLTMRFMVIGGLIFTMIYVALTFVLATCTKLKIWPTIHGGRIKCCWFFVLVDAGDYERKQKGWVIFKVGLMTTFVLVFVIFNMLGIFTQFLTTKTANFLYFIGLVFMLYYLNNLLLSSKPFGLVALLLDKIPPVGKNFVKHQKEMLKVAREKNGNSDEQSVTMTHSSKNMHYSNHTYMIQNNISAPIHSTTANDLSHTDNDAPSELPLSNTLKSARKHIDADQIDAFDVLSRRYENFEYKYKWTQMRDYKEKGIWSVLFTYNYERLKGIMHNFSNYWLNVYRPFDEYDMDLAISSDSVLRGFQWMRPLFECKIHRYRSRWKRCKKCTAIILDNTMNIFCAVFFLAIIIGLYYTAGRTQQQANAQIDLASVNVDNSINATQYYSICSESFGDENNPTDEDLTILDMLFLVEITYEMDNYSTTELINTYFEGQYELVFEKIDDISSDEDTPPYFYHIESKTSDVDIIGVRGTASVEEALQDISLYVEIALFETLQWIVPFLNALPTSFIRQLMFYVSVVEGAINSEARQQYDIPVFAHLCDYIIKNETKKETTVYVVGHSLGGGIAQIVAAKAYEPQYCENIVMEGSITSLGICSPGTLYTSAKFGFSVESLDKTSMSLLPRRDPVSSIDDHGGNVQFVECRESTPWNCHLMASILCETFNNCPSALITGNRKTFWDCFCDTKIEITNEFNITDEIPNPHEFGRCMNLQVTQFAE